MLRFLKRILGAKPAGASERSTVVPPAESVSSLRARLGERPDDLALQATFAAALMATEDYEAAQTELERLAHGAPVSAEVHLNLGHIQCYFGRINEAIASYRSALAIAPGHTDAHSHLVRVLNYSANHSPADIFDEHLRFGERYGPPAAAPRPDPSWPRKLRVGYVSPDFRSHVVASFTLPLLARHDRNRFDVCCYFTYPRADAVTQGMCELADEWVNAAALSDTELARQIRDDRIDILVDLAGHMAHQRLGVFAQRPAPVQVTYLGYPNTTGLRAIDYRLSDRWADPPGESDRYSTERIVRLDRTFVCYRPGPEIHEVEPLPAAQAGCVTFGCFNNYQKLSEPFFDAAARVLLAVPDSRLLLKARPLASRRRVDEVRGRLAGKGIDDGRLIIRGWAPRVEDHLGAYREVDIALDSFPYNGTTTTCEALWMGAPVVTLRGDRHAGRVGSSLLHAVGLEALVARDAADYVQIAARLAVDSRGLTDLRKGMRSRMRQSPLMDEPGFVREIERCYHEMWQSRLRASA